ncbi:HlyD family efflux transporter periplasmic adaptor subunit [Virgibacillus halophilus]|uniref:HlyD family efflux transporter periplasmic adaptor subunit n=2 Tax=Tigheibacillus halophilus TaxID=361280 RepID=A0ABU5C7V2_9BACI|nr:HlyD family efflux transporter periplasmic adaptor subunit [Virgibacillus halophilus]
MHESYQSNGVVRYADESNVYFDKSLGNFNEFLVKKGETVHSGDPLFSYDVNDYDQAKTKLEQKADLLGQEIQAIESAIGKVQSSTASGGMSSSDRHSSDRNAGSSDDNLSRDAVAGAEDSSAEMNRRVSQLQNEFQELQSQVENTDSEQAKVLTEQYIAEKEKERDQKEAEQQSIQSQISTLSSEGSTITVESPYSGKITSLSKELKAPLLTIQDPEKLEIAGEITEKERIHTDEGMQAAVAMQESGATFKGEISELSDDPTDMKVNGRSLYPFSVTVKADKQAKKLLPGYHANMKIFTKIVPDALIAKEEAIFGQEIWVMNYKGKLIPQIAKTGISENGRSELNNELEPGEWLAVAPESSQRRQATFITPLKITNLGWLDLQTDKKSNLKYLVTGLLSR